MRKLNPKALVFVLATFLSACSNNEVGPSNEAPVQGDVILNSTFELDGNPSLQGWRAQGSPSRGNLSFSADVPAFGSPWSLQLATATVETTVTFINVDSIKTYVITFWAKGKGYVNFSINSPTRGVGIVGPVNCTLWTAISDTLVRVDSTENSLYCELSSLGQDSSSSVLFNDVRVVAIEP